MKDLIEFKKNIIAWYPIEKGKSVLEVGFDEEIFKELESKTENVTKVENAGEISGSYDYITLIGTFENHSIEEIKNIVAISKAHLNQGGKILLAMKNKFGMKYYAGEKINDKLSSFESVVNNPDGYIGYTSLKNILDELDLKYKFYYPLPDFNFTNVIFTDEFLPNKDSIDARDINLCKEEDFIVFSERDAYKELISENKDLFKYFSNSYFVEIGNDNNFENIKYVSYGITRRKEYQIKTIIREKDVLKSANNSDAKSHIDSISNNIDILTNAGLELLDKKEDESIVSRYLEGAKSYDEVLMNIYKEEGLDALVEKIKEYKENIIDKLGILENAEKTVFDKYEVAINDELKSKLHFTKNGVLDLIFQNTLVSDDKLYVYDQEWFEENVPLEFILYRAIFYFTELKNTIDINLVYEKLGLSEFKDVFEELETNIQNQIKDLDIWNMHLMTNKNVSGFSNILDNYKMQIGEANKHAKELEEVVEKYISQIDELNQRIGEKDAQLEDYANQLRAIANSISWKITKPIRSISSKLHGNK